MDDRQLIGLTAPVSENKSGGTHPHEGLNAKKITACRRGDKTRFSQIYPRLMTEIGSGNDTEIAISTRFAVELFASMNDFITADSHLRKKSRFLK